jgi:hypothetical protein
MPPRFDRPLFDRLGEQLLSRGVARGHVRRYMAELRDHLDDLVAEESASGKPTADAQAAALARLGDVETLSQAMAQRREFRAFAARAPLAAYVLAPSALVFVCTALVVGLIVLGCNAVRGEPGSLTPLPAWLPPFATTTAAISTSLFAILLGWGLAAAAVRQRARMLWPVLGMLALAFAGTSLQVRLTPPAPGGLGELDFSSSLGASATFVARFVIHLLAMAAPYVSLSLWRSAPAETA